MEVIVIIALIPEQTIILRLLLALLLGGAIGFEREFRHRPAGLRTHILVCIGACSIMIMSELLFEKYYAMHEIKTDITRMGAQVVSGIGFLGAGTIMRHNSSIRGLTTAASIWAVGCIGLATGSGLYYLAIATTLVISLSLVMFSKFSNRIDQLATVRELFLDLDNKKAVGSVTLFMTKNNIKILDIEFINNIESENVVNKISIRVVIKIPPEMLYYKIVSELENISGVQNISQQ